MNIEQSKINPFTSGVKIIVGRTREDLCPVAAVLAYMSLQGPSEGSLFRFKDGRPLTRQRLVSKMRELTQRIGIDDQEYSSHRFHIGAATTAACRGIQDSLIETMNHRESVAYKLYVRTLQEQLVAVVSTLARKD